MQALLKISNPYFYWSDIFLRAPFLLCLWYTTFQADQTWKSTYLHDLPNSAASDVLYIQE